LSGVRQGRFITLEGGEGTGKSTQSARLAQRLTAAGREVVATREPGGSPGAEAIRALLVEGAPDRWSPTTETLLMYAARRDHIERLIQPALARSRRWSKRWSGLACLTSPSCSICPSTSA
jgi:dTMP kinase